MIGCGSGDLLGEGALKPIELRGLCGSNWASSGLFRARVHDERGRVTHDGTEARGELRGVKSQARVGHGRLSRAPCRACRARVAPAAARRVERAGSLQAVEPSYAADPVTASKRMRASA